MTWVLWLLCHFATAVRGEGIDARIAPGATVHHNLPAQGGYVEIDVEAQGTRLEAIAGDLKLTLQEGPVRAARLCYLAAEGPARVSLRSLEAVEERPYRLTITVRMAQPEDTARAKGCLLQSEARRALSPVQRQRLLEEARQAYGAAGDPRGLAEVLTPLGEALWETGRRAEAIQAHKQAVTNWNKLGQVGREAAAMVLLGLGYVLQPGQTDLGIQTLREASRLAERHGDPLAEAAALSSLVSLSSRTALREDSGAMARRAIELFRQAGDRKGEAEAWNHYGQALQRTSLEEAAEAYRASLRLRRELADEAGIAQILNNLGTVFDQQGEPKEAIAALEEALAIRKRVAPPRSIANTQHNLGVQYIEMGEYERAIEIFEAALVTWVAIGDVQGTAASKTDLAYTYLLRGSRYRAGRLYGEALALNRSIKNQAGEANVLRSLAGIHRSRGQYEEALRLLREATALSRKGQFRLTQVRALHALASVCLQAGRHRDALEAVEEAKPLAVSIDRSEMASLLTTAGSAHLRLGQTSEALASYREAAAIGEQIEKPSLLVNIHAGMAEAYLGSNDVSSARQAAFRAMELLEDLRNAQASPAARAGLLAERRHVYHLAASVLLRSGDDEEAFAAVERGRGRSLTDLLARPAIPAPEFREERVLRNALSAKANALARLEGNSARQKDAAALRAAIGKLQDSYNATLERLARRHPELTSATAPATLAAIRKRLPADAALLAFSLGNSQSYLWRVTRTSLDAFAIGPRDPIEAAVGEFRANLKAGPGRLGNLLFGDRKLNLNRYGKLYLIPDGDLHLVPWAALPELQTAKLAVLPSATALARLPAAPPLSGRPIAIFADPVYQPSDTPFQRLRFSAMEAAAIQQFGGPATIRHDGPAASRTALLEAPLHRYGILHFATHAVADAGQPELSAIVLSLTGGKSQPLDGFLRAYEIERLRLRSPLVVLSACDTAVGPRLEGEGPLALSRAFLAAGARAVVATLWAVDDGATAHLMRVFYEGLLRRGLDPAAALQRAQQAVKSEPRWADPHYWAGFLYTGV